MYTLDTWQQSATFDPANPNQMIQEHYTALPGGYSSFYFNKVPNTSSLEGLAEAAGMSFGWKLGLAVGVAGILYMAFAKAKRKR